MAIRPYSGKWVTKTFNLSTAYYVGGNGQFMMASSGEAVQASSQCGFTDSPILGLYTGPAIATSALASGKKIALQCPIGTVYVIDTATSGAFTSGTVGGQYGLSSGSATGNFSSTGFGQHIGLANSAWTPFVHAKFGASSGSNIFAWVDSLQAHGTT